MTEVRTRHGSCHCGAVAYEVDTDLHGLVECNCSHCYRKGLVLNFVGPDAFRLTAGEDAMSTHTFNTHNIQHRFCDTCGVQAFAEGKTPSGHPMVAINVRTLTDLEPFDWKAEKVDGRSF
ncbi:MAG: GFA family protein [Brevundimonas sp.]|nr:MAG: GFA family protein [Brevundimonas sp.]